MNRLRSRVDYLATAKGARVVRPGFVLQIAEQPTDAPPRIGFTVSRRVGNAVARNRVRRRLREIARLAEHEFQPGSDYVLVGRRAAVARPFSGLVKDIHSALSRAPKQAPSDTASGRGA
ncbi:MAG: ribonuclease P protein component [Alphaproteobacteria bacterium]